MKKFLIILSFGLFLAGCTGSDSSILDAGNGTHEILIVGDTGFTSLSKMQLKAVNEAHSYCAQQNKQYVFVSKRVQPTSFAVWPEVDLFFKCK